MLCSSPRKHMLSHCFLFVILSLTAGTVLSIVSEERTPNSLKLVAVA